MQSLALGANDIMSMMGQCYQHLPETRPSFGPQLQKSTQKSAVSCSMSPYLLLLSFLPLFSLPLPDSFLQPSPRLACQCCKPPPHCQPVCHTQVSLPPHLIQVPGVSWKSQPVPDTCPRNKRGGVLMEPPNTLPHQVK